MRFHATMPLPVSIIVLPVAGAGAAAAVISRFVAEAVHLDDKTTITVGTAIVVMLAIGRWIYRYGQECNRQKTQMRVMSDLLEITVRDAHGVNEDHPRVRKLLVELNEAKRAALKDAEKDKR